LSAARRGPPLVLVCAALFAPTVSAHGAGSGTVSKNGSFVLTPTGTSNASSHAYLPTLGLPIGPGDVLVWSWSANGATGPPIAFDIHSHVGGYVQYVNVAADRANNSWKVPGSSDYMVYWANPNTESENVTYAFQLIPPPVDLWPLYLLLVAPLVMIGALIWHSRRKKRRSHWPVDRGRRAGFQKIDIQDRRYIICAPSHGSR